MGNHRPAKTTFWIKLLEHYGFKLDRIKSSHHQYKKNGALRPIPVWGDKKQIPPDHIRSGCKTLGITIDEAYKWMEKNC